MITCEAILAGSGEGTLELNEQGEYLRFSVMKGVFSKHPEIVRDIQINDIKSLKQSGKQMEVSWKGERTFLDVFIVNNPESLSRIHESIMRILDKKKKTEKEKADAKQKRDDLAKNLHIIIDVVNTLFDILISLNGRVDWPRIEDMLKTLKGDFEEVKNTSVKELFIVTDDVTDELGSAIGGRSPVEGIKIVCIILQKMHEFFRQLTSTKDEFLKDLHPNYSDAMQVIETYYVLNDIALGITVKDEKAKEKIDVFAVMLEDLGKKTSLGIDIDKARGIINELVTSAVDKRIIEESRRKFEAQIQSLLS